MSIAANIDEKAHGFWKMVGGDVYDALTESQREAIVRAARQNRQDEINSDIRLSFGKYFLVVLFGRERRNRDRLVMERKTRPVFVGRNLPVLLFLWGSIIYTVYSLLGLGIYLLGLALG